MKRTLGNTGIEVSAIGMGCWAIGGPVTSLPQGTPSGWGAVDDEESVRAINEALDCGITFFDTADAYGAGHSERVLGRALQGKRDTVVIATKFGILFDEQNQAIVGETTAEPDYIRSACDASLKRLATDVIDLYQFHWGNYDPEKSLDVVAVLEQLVEQGKIRSYGWSTDNPDGIRAFAQGPNCSAVQFSLNVLQDRPDMLPLLDQLKLAGLNKNPLNKGLLTGKFTRTTTFPDNDLRTRWDFADGPTAKLLDQFEAIREILCVNGRTCTQGALCWNLTRSAWTVPIPGIKTPRQARENAGAMTFGLLSDAEMTEISDMLAGFGSDD